MSMLYFHDSYVKLLAGLDQFFVTEQLSVCINYNGRSTLFSSLHSKGMTVYSKARYTNKKRTRNNLT